MPNYESEEELIVDEIDKDELFYGFEKEERKSDWQMVEVEVVGEAADPDEPAKEGATKIELKTNAQKIMFNYYFRIVEAKGHNITIECKTCNKIMKDMAIYCSVARGHLRVCINLCMH